jgi:hypothetical protein
VGEGFDALVSSLNQPAPLDLRINTQKKKREAVLAELHAAGLEAQATPYSPWGIRLKGKPSLAKVPAFVQGEVEVQDEGSQLLALLLDAKRGEMVVDFCAGAGGKTLAIGASMRNSGRLYAFDTSGHRLDALKPRLARSGLSNVHPVAIAHERDERIKRLAGKIDAIAQGLNLTCLGHSTENGGDAEVHRLSQGAHHIGDLGCEFAGWRQDKSKRAPGASATTGELSGKPCDHRDAKGEGLARACLATAQYVFAGKGVGQSVDLDGEGLVNTHAGKGGTDVGGDAKCCKG